MFINSFSRLTVMASGCAQRDLVIFLAIFFILASFDVLKTSKIEISISPHDARYFHVGNSVSTVSLKLSNVDKKTRVTNKSAPIPNMMKLSGLLRLAKYGLTAKVNASLYLLLCGDISSNPMPTASNLNNLNLPKKGLRFGQWNVNYFTETEV